jgi:hypothetical protein
MLKLVINKTILKSIFLSNAFILISVFLISEYIVNPIGEFSLNDDWAFAKVAQGMHEHNTFNIGSYAAMTLLAHVLWGCLFTKIFGFSFFVLRLSVFCLALLTVLYFEKFVFSITKNKMSALLTALCLLFNPIFFNLSNSYMTDGTFLAFFFFSIYHYHKYCTQQKTSSLIWFSCFTIVAIFTRQFAIIIPITFFFLSGLNWLISKLKRNEFLFSIGLLVLCLTLLYLFEWYNVSKIGSFITYHGVFFSAKVETKLEIINLLRMFKLTNCASLFYTGLFVFPVLCFSVIPILKNFFRSRLVITVPLLVVFISFYILLNIFYSGPVGNILYNGGLGAETSIDVLQLQTSLNHSKIIGFNTTLKTISLIGLFLFTLQLLSRVNLNFKFNKETLLHHHFAIWISFLFLSYSALISVSFGLLDRYLLLPALFGCILLIKYLDFTISKFSILTLLAFACFSILATKDYFSYNRTNQKMVKYLTKTKNVNPRNIHAGIEYIMWNLYDDNGWELLNKCEQEYYISFGNVPFYHKIEEFRYQRYFPYRNEKLFILKKN